MWLGIIFFGGIKMRDIHINYIQATCDPPDNLEYDDNIDPVLENFNRNHIISRPRMELFAIITLVYCAFTDDSKALNELKKFLGKTGIANIASITKENLKSAIKVEEKESYDCDNLLKGDNLGYIRKIVWAPANLFLGPKNRYDDPSQKNEQIPISLTEKLFEKYNIVNRNWNAICQSFNEYSDGKKINEVLKANTIEQENIKQFVNSFIDYINIKYTVNVTQYSDWVVKDINVNKYYCFYYTRKKSDGELENRYNFGLDCDKIKSKAGYIKITDIKKCVGVNGNYNAYEEKKNGFFFISRTN